MEKKATVWKTKGMNRDISVSSFNPEFAFENYNLRLSTSENNTLMSWVNEKGTQVLSVQILKYPWKDTPGVGDFVSAITGTPIGTAIINHQLVLFTTNSDWNDDPQNPVGHGPDYIYSLNYNQDATSLEGILLYNGTIGFDINYPLETLVSYEAEHIQKVYWTDGKNQPRIINIKAKKDKLRKWNHTILNGIDNYIYNTDFLGVRDTFFDFVPVISLSEKMEVKKITTGGGTFASGVIQYCFTYFNKHEQQSNVVEVSPLFYLALTNRGASVEEKVTSSFEITISNLDTNFEYVRIYSIQRTSLNSDPFVKLLEDIPIKSTTITYIDNGTGGANIDPTELLFVGGKEITALTMADKDKTLFLGNLMQKNTLVKSIQNYFNRIRGRSSAIDITFHNDGKYNVISTGQGSGFYAHNNTLDKNRREITTLKGGETYRFGFQLQKNTGEWLDPIFIDDATNDKYPNTNVFSTVANLVYAEATINLSNIREDVYSPPLINPSLYKRIRPVIVFPTIADRTVLCQGVVNPTVFTINDRKNKYPYAQASWFFRPFVTGNTVSTGVSASGRNPGVVDIDDPNWNEACLPGEKPNISIDPYIKEHSVPKQMFIAVLSQTGVDTILSSGKLCMNRKWYKISDDSLIESRYIECPVTAIYIRQYNGEGGQSGDVEYAFIPNWPSGYEDAVLYKDGYNEEIPDIGVRITNDYEFLDAGFYTSYGIRENLNYVDTNLVYEGLKTTGDSMAYYVKPSDAGAPDSYVFKFFFHTRDTSQESRYHLYGVTFNAVEDTAYIPTANTSAGTNLSYTHYAHLRCQNEVIGDSIAQKNINCKSVEIQGSYAEYSHPYITGGTIPETKSNSEFFIDQSIVTLNSPDIDFDTQVQVYGTEGLKFRIIGAIPITGSASAFAITTKSNMLARDYKSNDDEPATAYETALSSFGSGALDTRILHNNTDVCASQRLVADLLWNDIIITDIKREKKKTTDTVTTTKGIYNYMVFPWQRSGSLNNDYRNTVETSSELSTKKESTVLYSASTEYFTSKDIPFKDFQYLNAQVQLTQNDFVHNIRLPKQKSTSSEVNYYPNIDKVLFNSHGYKLFAAYDSGEDAGTSTDTIINNIKEVTSPVLMKYKSTSHMVIALNAATDNINTEIPLIPYVEEIVNGTPVFYGDWKLSRYNGSDVSTATAIINHDYTTIWGDTHMKFVQDFISIDNLFKYADTHTSFSLLWLGELYKDVPKRFGGQTEEALLSNKWIVGGDAVDINENANSLVTLRWTEGDTYFQRYDCLKTYASTFDDPNQIVEILSFMCETHVNLDGRYDKNRGQIQSYNMHPTNFNLLNTSYSQLDNFFVIAKTDDDNEKLVYPNQIYYSKTKQSGADVDMYTNVTLASVMELDGDKGELKSLRRFNDQIIAFQDSGISQILYNENVQISSTEGVPIEIANSGKVQGKRYISDTIGCSNKWSIVNTPYGIYFMDSNDKSIYLFNGQLNNLSVSGGFNVWSKNNIPDAAVKWNPVFNDNNKDNFVTYYDKINQDVHFINKNTCLTYSERFGAFTSFYSYNDTPYFCNLDGTGIWINKYRGKNPIDTDYHLWQHRTGEYNKFFNEIEPYSMTLIGNPDPFIDKVFANLEFRACVDSDGTEGDTERKPFNFHLPFDSLEAWNEYQHGISNLKQLSSHAAFKHHTSNKDATLKRKFRIWRCDIPRDNVNPENDGGLNISRIKAHPLDRMRNPWVYLKLLKEALESPMNRTEIHDILMYYYM